jgi:hypothetical protein
VAEDSAQLQVRLMELGLACTCSHSQTFPDFTVRKAIDIVEQYYTSSRFGQALQRASQGHTFNQERTGTQLISQR